MRDGQDRDNLNGGKALSKCLNKVGIYEEPYLFTSLIK
jgi:hypothetical protein